MLRVVDGCVSRWTVGMLGVNGRSELSLPGGGVAQRTHWVWPDRSYASQPKRLDSRMNGDTGHGGGRSQSQVARRLPVS